MASQSARSSPPMLYRLRGLLTCAGIGRIRPRLAAIGTTANSDRLPRFARSSRPAISCPLNRDGHPCPRIASTSCRHSKRERRLAVSRTAPSVDAAPNRVFGDRSRESWLRRPEPGSAQSPIPIHSRQTVRSAAMITGPRKRPTNPNDVSPPRIPISTNRKGSRVVPPMSAG
jgi:hypothetical protein